MNNCDTCVWATRNGGCASWGCDYIPMREAAEAWKKERSEEGADGGLSKGERQVGEESN